MAAKHAGEERAAQSVERAVADAPTSNIVPASRILALQRSAGNAAVARLASSGRLGRTPRLARAWGGTATGRNLGPEHGGARPGGWNAQDTQVAGTTRIPVDDLPTGFRGDDDKRPTTTESAQRRAIVIVPNRVDVTAGSVEVLLHFHGLNIGYRERNDGTVRDVERDMIEQQLAGSGRNMIAILAQGEVAYGQGRFSIGNPQTYVDAVLAKAVPHLPNPPANGTLTASHLVISGHSGGGPNAVNYANQMQATATEDEWAGSPPLLLFDAINGPGELARLQTVVRDWLTNDSRWLQASADPGALLRRRGLKLRSTYSSSDIYVRMNRELDVWLTRWFASTVPAALSSVAAEWRRQYRVEGVGGAHDDTMATGRQAPRPTRADPTAGGRREEAPSGVDGRSAGAGVPTYSGGGNLENALNALPPNPIPPRERTQLMEPLLSRKRRLDRQDPDPEIPPPTPEERQRAAELLIHACDMKAQEHRINTAQVCLVETQDGTPGTAEITHLPASYVRARLGDRASNAALNTAFDAAVERILGQGVRRSEMMMTRRAYDQVPAILRLLESQFIHDPNASSLDLLGPDRSRRYRQDTQWGHEDYPGGTAGANEGRARAMAGELSAIRPERRANAGGDSVVNQADMALPRMREYVESQLVEVPDLSGFRLNRHASAAFVRMRDAARADADPATGNGVELAPSGGAGSFYRTPAASAASSQASGNAAAVASYSTHNLGLAVDLRMSFDGHNYQETTTRPMRNVVDMRQSPAHKFLFVRGARYGFYPYQNEPWHWEYNPPGFRELFMRQYREWLAAQQGGQPALQRTAADAAVSRMLQRSPAPPSGLRQDRTQVRIVPGAGATDPMDYVEFTTQPPHSEVVGGERVEFEGQPREFSYESEPWNLAATWRYFDGGDRQVSEISDMPRDIAIWPRRIRDHVERQGRSAFGTWTVRLEKDAYYDDVTFDVTEGSRPPTTLEGQTTESYFNIRQFPSQSAQVLGTLTGSAVSIRADDKARVGDRTWYRVTLRAPVGSLPSGTVGWIVADAVTLITPWTELRTQLTAWERANAGLSLDARITKLRQMCHNSDLPFDAVIGTAPGTEYADTRRFTAGEWELLRDSQQARMPDGRVVDVYHLLVGLDVLPRRRESTNVELGPGGLITRNIGQNYSAATWSGDIGAAAADAYIRQDAEWERQNASASAADRIRRYYTTRVSEADLLGNVDAWGIDAARSAPSAPTTIEGLLSEYYGAPVDVAPGTGAQNTSRRRSAVERFLAHYGFATGTPAAALVDQPARASMADQIQLFARVWVERRDYFRSIDDSALRSQYVEPMTDEFLRWLDALAADTGARTP